MYLIIFHTVLVVMFTIRVLARDDLLPSSRMAWFMVIVVLPIIGSLIYFLFGETDLGHRANALQEKVSGIVKARAGKALGDENKLSSLVSPELQKPFLYAASINGFNAQPGNTAELMPDAVAARDRLIEDIDAATDHVHVLYYIWLTDNTGTRTAQALIRAARRGVKCRVMVDGLGSRGLIKSLLWKEMEAAGVELAVALPIDRPLRIILTSRLDIRNHRKITVIDGRIAYCGSQNCADPEFRVKAKYAPWVDIVLRMKGPVVAQKQILFATDWMKETDTPVESFSFETNPVKGGFVALAMGDGPTERKRASPQLFVTLIESAQWDLTITTPYFVPDPTVIEALCAAAYRKVNVRLVLPRRNDSWIVAAASKSYYRKLLEAGAKIYEYKGGLLHSKTLTVDDNGLFLGSSNMDMRSFDLNYENDVLIQDRDIVRAVRARQQEYISDSVAIELSEVLAWQIHHRIWHNVIATIGPVL